MRGSSDERRVQRILQIIERDDQAMVLVPWLRDLVDGANSRLASKAAMILCRLTKNPMVVDRFLRSEDPRVRANAVEGLWGAAHLSRARSLLREAAEDSHHRVVANALVELYRCGEASARLKIEQLATHSDPLFRAAMAWAIGEIGSSELLPILEPLEHDAALSVRLRAGRTAKRLRAAINSEPVAPAPAAEGEAPPAAGAESHGAEPDAYCAGTDSGSMFQPSDFDLRGDGRRLGGIHRSGDPRFSPGIKRKIVVVPQHRENLLALRVHHLQMNEEGEVRARVRTTVTCVMRPAPLTSAVATVHAVRRGAGVEFRVVGVGGLAL